MGNLPTTHHNHTAQGKQPVYKDTSLTTLRLAPHESAHEAFSTMELNELHESCSLHKHFSNLEKMLDEIEGQLFPELVGQNALALSTSSEKNGQRGNSRPSSSG